MHIASFRINYIQNDTNAAVINFPNAIGSLPNLYFRSNDTPDTYTPESERMVIMGGSGNVGIGTDCPDKELTVNGTIKARTEVIVEETGCWPDYVFDKNYSLLSLKQVEEYVSKNYHLPNVPPADTIEKEGLKMAEMNRIMMEKIEELYLHVIDLNNQVQGLKKENEKLRK